MQNLSIIATVALIHLLAVISPGPDLIITIKNSLSYSRRTGIYTAIGVGMGIAVHISYCVAGLALIISKSIIIFNTIKFLGAAYLIYIGVKSLLAKSDKIQIKNEDQKRNISPLSAIRIGFLTNVLNPKATVFFLSLFTFVISPETSGKLLLTLSAIMVVDTALWFSLVAIFLTQKRVYGIFERFQGVFNKVFGAILVGLGLKIASSSN